MNKNRNAVRAGIFMIASLVAAVFIVVSIEGAGQLTAHYQTHLIKFTLNDNIGGLRKGDDVRLGGLKVGSVDDIRFVKQHSLSNAQPDTDSIYVAISIPQQYTLTDKAKVGIETTLTGVTAVNISDLGAGQPLAEAMPLTGEPDAFTAFRRSLASAGPKINATLDKVDGTLDTYKQAGVTVSSDIHNLSFDVHERMRDVAFSAQRALDAIHELLGPSTKDFHDTMADVHDITSGLRRDLPPVTASAGELLRHMDAAVTKASGSLDDVKATLANARDISAGARSLIVRNQGRFDGIVAGLKKTSDNLDAASVEIRSSPWRLLYKPTPDEMANLNLYDAARQFAEGANDLNDAAVALRDALHDKQADPAKVQKLYDALADKFAQFKQVEDGLWKKVRE